MRRANIRPAWEGALTGTTTRTFRIDACLGRGGFGEVYRSRMLSPSGLEVEVALKVLRADLAPTSQAARRLRDEGQLLGKLSHPSIVRVYDLVELDGRLALITEYIPGADLAHVLADGGIPHSAGIEALAKVADALHAAWTTPVDDDRRPLGLVHRDLKPANIRISRRGEVKLLDFGIAWSGAVDRAAHTQTSALVGSPAYMAPERFLGLTPAPASDMFSLGACLFEVLTGQRLFAGASFVTLAGLSQAKDRFAQRVHARMSELPSNVDPQTAKLLTALLSYDPAARPTADTVAELLFDHAAAADGVPLAQWCRRKHWVDDSGEHGPWAGRTLVETVPTQASSTLAGFDAHEAPGTPPTWEGSPPTVSQQVTDAAAEPSTDPAATDPAATDPGARRAPLATWMAGSAFAAALAGAAVLAVALWPPSAPVEPAPAVVLPAPTEVAAEPPPPTTPSPAAAPAEAPAVEAPAASAPAPQPTAERPPSPTPPRKVPSSKTVQPAATPPPAAAEQADPAPALLEPSDPSPPEAVAPPPATVSLVLGADTMRVVLRGDDGVLHTFPAKVPPGHYIVQAEFDTKLPSRALDIDVTGGQALTVSCSKVLRRCLVVP